MDIVRSAGSKLIGGLTIVAVLFMGGLAAAMDPPHVFTNGCNACHITHNSPGGGLTTVGGNDNLCLSCHQAGGTATNHPFAIINQALPWPGLPVGTNATGNSHRWDSGPAGHIQYLRGAATNSTGTILPAGVYTGVYAKTYTLTITNAGNVGTARFNWIATTPGGGAGTNVLTAPSVALDQGVAVIFSNGTGTSFQLNDRWHIYVRPDLRQATNATLLLRLSTNGVAFCSTCHDQHSQEMAPFDLAAPAYNGTNTGSGRHFMRINNDTHQLCFDCHAARNVTNSVFGSHPVDITIITNAYNRVPSALPLERTTTNIVCLTCHQVHYSPGNNGMILRLTNTVALCVSCHTLADTNTPAAHLVSTNANTLWPGGKWGSLMPARTDPALRGSCLNCHAVHGWPDAANPTNHYRTLLADFEENLCYTCHGTNGPAVKLVWGSFTNAIHHPVSNTDPYRRAGRTVECTDCHHVHDALANSHVYTNTATAARNQVSNPLKGVAGVAFATNGLVNFQVAHASLYSVLSETNGGAAYEYQICFKCHSGYSFLTNNTGTATFTSNSTAVTGSGTGWTNLLAGMWIARTGDTQMYVITNVANATSLTIQPAYRTTTATGQAFTIWNIPPGLTPLYTNGTATFTTNSTTVTGTGTGWTNALVGLWIYPTNNPAAASRIVAIVNATNLTINPAYRAATAAAQRYAIAGASDVAQEFSPLNRSGHPIITGLTNYPNSLAPKALAAAAMKAPWNSTAGLGVQTMMCSDCHDATGTNYVASAAQGPHGSAAQFMLRGPNANNWPNVTLSNIDTSWCMNCHNNSAGVGHTKGNHSGLYCYQCHIIIPHGGKVSRLIATRSPGLPARYAWNNNTNTVAMGVFRKAASGSYAQSGYCYASCYHTTAVTTNPESW